MKALALGVSLGIALAGLSSGASAGCTSGTPFPVRVPDLATFLQNKTVCVPPTYVDPMKWQEYHHTDGTLVEYGQGQPESVGTWSVARNLVTYSYTGDKPYTYSVYDNGNGTYSFCSVNPEIIARIKTGGGGCR